MDAFCLGRTFLASQFAPAAPCRIDGRASGYKVIERIYRSCGACCCRFLFTAGLPRQGHGAVALQRREEAMGFAAIAVEGTKISRCDISAICLSALYFSAICAADGARYYRTMLLSGAKCAIEMSQPCRPLLAYKPLSISCCKNLSSYDF